MKLLSTRKGRNEKLSHGFLRATERIDGIPSDPCRQYPGINENAFPTSMAQVGHHPTSIKPNLSPCILAAQYPGQTSFAPPQ